MPTPEERLEARRKYMRDYMRKRRADNPEREAALAARGRGKRKDDEEFKKKNRARASKYRTEHPESVREKSREAYRRNPEKRKAYAIEYRAQNTEKLTKYFEDHYATNTGKVKARVKEYRLLNPEKCRVQGHNKRARKREVGGKLSPWIVDLLLQEQGGCCAYCDADLVLSGMHLDHYIPTALDGPNEDWNVQLLCPTCNCKKNAKHPLDFLKSIALPDRRLEQAA